MPSDLIPVPLAPLSQVGLNGLPAIVMAAGEQARWRFLEFFAANIRNKNTRLAYLRAVLPFLTWCEARGLRDLRDITPIVVAAYIEQHPGSPPTVKQHLAAIRMLFDWLVIGQVIPMNPASAVRGPKYIVKRGKTPVLSAEDAAALLAAIDTRTIAGLRDRALIGVLVHTVARVGAVVGMRVQDYYPSGKRWWLRLHEKGGKFHEVPANHKAEAYMDAYLDAARIKGDPKGPLFRTLNRRRQLTATGMNRFDVFHMIKRRAVDAGLPPNICCHTFRATGITAYLQNGGRLEVAQALAAHESPRTTKLYDRTADEITLQEVERIASAI
jgi:site-specific recombinase XerD